MIDPRLILTLAAGLLLLLNGLTAGRSRPIDGDPDGEAEPVHTPPPEA